jgi:hypothetical protein
VVGEIEMGPCGPCDYPWSSSSSSSGGASCRHGLMQACDAAKKFPKALPPFSVPKMLRADYLVGRMSNLPVAVDSHDELLYKKSLSTSRLKLTRTGVRSDS